MGLNPAKSIPTRIAAQTVTSDSETLTPEKYQLIAIERVRKELSGIARQIDDRTKAVDEYQIESTTVIDNVTQIQVLPQFERIAERITSILVTGPATTAFTLQIGDRILSLSTDSRGIIVLSPVSMIVNYSEKRILQSSTAGPWFLELMGWADERY